MPILLNNITPAICNNKYIIKMGYKRSADNSCMGGVSHEDKELDCPGNGGIGSFFSMVFYFLWSLIYYGFITGILAYLGFWVYDKISKAKEDNQEGQGWSTDMLPNQVKNLFGQKNEYSNLSNGGKHEDAIMDDDDDDDYAEEI